MSFPRTNATVDISKLLQPKARSRKSAAAFTLAELLVVITVISILIALLFPAFRAVQDQAKSAQAKNDIIQIVTAVTAYYTEYGKYPVSHDLTDMTLDGLNGNTNDKLFNALRGQDSVVNPKNIVLISPPAVKDNNNPRSGISGSDGQYYDPWGTAYVIRIDSTYDNVVAPNPYSANAGFTASIDAGVIPWSYGKDKASDSVPGPASDKKIGSNADDVISWQ
jgi:prepilin-type N-terminal cleavage/methylation domain-containing protein